MLGPRNIGQISLFENHTSGTEVDTTTSAFSVTPAGCVFKAGETAECRVGAEET